LGQEGNGPGTGGTPREYGCIAASTDSVALDAVLAQAMGYRPGDVLHLAQAAERSLGTVEVRAIRIEGDRRALDFGAWNIPRERWSSRTHVPAWVSAPVQKAVRVRPVLGAAACVGCGACVEVCPKAVITLDTPGRPPRFDLDRCIGCFCCAEICPQAALTPHQNWAARLFGVGL
jgi:ferredoxin